MRSGLEVLRCLGLMFFCVGLVLLVPSSAWADDTEQPSTSASPSPSDGSSTPQSEPTEQPPESSPTLPPSSDSSTTPEPEPTVTETVTIIEQQAPEMALMAEGTAEDPMIVQLDEDTRSLILLTACLSVGCLGLIAVSAFRS